MAELKTREVIHKRISRKVQPERFASLEVSIETESEIEWRTDEERAAKCEEITRRLLLDLNTTTQQTCDELKIDRYTVFGSRMSDVTSAPEGTNNQAEEIPAKESIKGVDKADSKNLGEFFA